MPLTLRQNFSWTFLGNVIYAACQWAMLIVLAKLGTPEMVGQFTLGLAIAAPVIMFTNLNLRAAQATDAIDRYRFSDYFGLRLISSAIALLLLFAITVAAGYGRETAGVILIVGFAKGVEAVSDIVYGLIQKHERMDRIAVSMMIKGALSVLFLASGVHLTGSVIGGVIGLAIAWIIVLISYDLRSALMLLKHRSHPTWKVQILRSLVWLCLPLGFAMMLISLNANIPRYFIEHYLSERELGIFAAIAYLMTAGTTIVNALGESASPRLSKYYAMQDFRAFWRLLLKLIAIALFLGLTAVLIAIVAGKQVLTLLYQPEYAQYSDLFVWLMIASTISYVASFLGYGMTAARYFSVQVPLLMTTTGVSAWVCVGFVPRWGLFGAAIALISAASIQAILSLGIVIHAIKQLRSAV